MKIPILAVSYWLVSSIGLAQVEGFGDLGALGSILVQYPLVGLVIWLNIGHQKQLEKVLTDNRTHNQQIDSDNRQNLTNAANRIETGLKQEIVVFKTDINGELGEVKGELKAYRDQMAMNNAVIADYAKATELIDHLTNIIDKQDARINSLIRTFFDNANITAD